MSKTSKSANFVSLAVSYPALFAQWHPTRNVVKAETISAGVKTIVWWLGSCGHEWEAQVRNRTVLNRGCPICSNRLIVTGINDLVTVDPNLAKEWHPTKNIQSPFKVGAGTAQKAWWQCEKGHEWQAGVGRRHKEKSKCPVCLNRVLLVGFNDLSTTHPHLVLEWDFDANKIILEEVHAGKIDKVSWVCRYGHKWIEKIVERTTRGTGCPICSGQVILAGFNDLATTHPHLVVEWGSSNICKPNEVKAGQKLQVYWECSLGHEWKTSIVNRTNKKGTGCPVCANRIILTGFNDLSTTHPVLAKEWHHCNFSQPNRIGAGADRKVYWTCHKGHKWISSVRNRVRGNGCPKCSKSSTSKIELALKAFLSSRFESINTNEDVKIFNPALNRKVQVDIIGIYRGQSIIIEYDGEYFHKDKADQDISKTQGFLAEGYVLVRVREGTLKNLAVQHTKLLQFNYKWSLEKSKIEDIGQQILYKLDKLICDKNYGKL